MTPDWARKEYYIRTSHLAASGSGHFKLRTWDRKTTSWRDAQRQLFENICAELDMRKMEET